MGISLKDFGNFAVGAIEQDKVNTKEKFAIRNEELQANRASLIKRKDARYKKDIEAYDAEKKKYDSLKSAAQNFDEKKISEKDYATQYYIATYGENFKLIPEKERTRMINSFNGATVDYTLKGSADEIEKKYALQEANINKITAKALEDARGDSFLINQIIGKNKAAKKDLATQVETALKSNDTVLTSKSISQEDSSLVGIPVKVSGSGLYSDIDKDSKTYTKFSDANYELGKKLSLQSDKYTDKNNNALIARASKEMNISNLKDYFTTDRDGNIVAFKRGGSEFAKSTSSMFKMYKDYANTNKSTDQLFVNFSGERNKLTAYYSKSNMDGVLANKIKQYGTAVVNGAVIGDGGSFSNILRKESNLIVIPTANTIDFDNTINGTNKVIGDDDRRRVSNLYAGVLIELSKNKNGEVNIGKIKDIQNELQNLEYGKSSKTSMQVNNMFLANLIKDNLITKDEALENRVFNYSYNNSEDYKKLIDNLGVVKPEDNQDKSKNINKTISVTINNETETLIDNEATRAFIEKQKEIGKTVTINEDKIKVPTETPIEDIDVLSEEQTFEKTKPVASMGFEERRAYEKEKSDERKRKIEERNKSFNEKIRKNNEQVKNNKSLTSVKADISDVDADV